MEENPIYGNLSFVESSMVVFTEAEPPRDKQKVNSDSQPKTQDCYANLTLKAPRLQSGRSSPQIHYSDVVQLEEPPNEDEGDTNTISNMSDLYASVQTQHAKTIDNADGGEGYANHL
ncbi:signaling threshold-regulating transmembrane adapter 1-like isoform X2 [Scomber scombrus]|uniref:Signaling threshold-regulating transmembrane adapter 1-like isoform X2 n=1 Tax=Scomber scombrus TaxID=13677 RepID=A0AAV1N8Q9_SCOSC